MKGDWAERIRQGMRSPREYAQALIKWLALAVVTGLLCGFVGAVFDLGVAYATGLREAHAWLLWALPVAGLLIVGIYKLTRTEGRSTNDVLDQVHQGQGLPFLLLPAIFISTILTHLCGGSAGREGAALQMGGTIGYHTGRLLHLDDRDLRTATMTGMAALFTALFGTPLAATVFAMMVVSVGVIYHADLLPCLVASLVAYGVSLGMGVEPTHFLVTAPALEGWMLLRVAGLAVLCALVSILFCRTLHFAEHGLHKLLPNPWVRVVVGGAAVIALTYLCGTTDYNGAGMNVIAAAIEQGQAQPAAFALKLLFTALTLAAGFKGGEVVPSFFVGATFGCVVGPLLGIPAGFSAAIGLAAVFCGVSNCPISAIFLAIELFGAQGMLYFALACGVSYVLSGYTGLYSSQTILYSKIKARYINIRANSAPEPEAGEAPSDQP